MISADTLGSYFCLCERSLSFSLFFALFSSDFYYRIYIAEPEADFIAILIDTYLL